ncbi:MAG TPA: alpha/beta hydrolase [Xanthobacteraceae bacterium]|nr:alpha/beta hydrolase [Xanthobacteraceae bacterium]
MSAGRVRGWIEREGVSLHCAGDGEGPLTLVLIHELSGTLDSWDLVVERLSPFYRIVRWDQRGAGLSEKLRTPITLEAMIDDLEAVLAAAGAAPPYVLAGIASGAAIAVGFAHRHPADVAGLLLCAPALKANPDRVRYLLDRADIAVRQGMRAIAEPVFARNYPPDMIADRAVYDEYRARFLAIDPVCYAAANAMLATLDAEQWLAGIACRCLILAGTRDLLRPAEQLAPLAQRLADARLQLIESGHIMVLQAPDAVAAAIDDLAAPLLHQFAGSKRKASPSART